MRKYVIALYIRLSVEDIKTESLSIPNQRLILREKAMSLPEWDNGEVLEFVDNGHTGTNFERPAVQELLTMVQAGSIDCIIVKDLSRFGRNSMEQFNSPADAGGSAVYRHLHNRQTQGAGNRQPLHEAQR